MAKKISFSDFKNAVDNRTIPLESLDDYVVFDDESPIPKLRFRQDALIDDAPVEYDVDDEIYRLLRYLDDEKDHEADIFSFASKKRVVAEGDSWYNLPEFFRPPAIADWIKANERFKVKNIARWGHTLKEIIAQNEYLTAIEEYNADFFMICGGGNDLQEGLANRRYIHPYDKSLDINDYFTDEGLRGLIEIESGLKCIMSSVYDKYPSLPIFIHGYDFPRPLVGSGKYIGKYLRRMGFPDNMMQPIVKMVLNKFNQHVEQAADACKTAIYINCRDMTEEFTWYDDMHPGKEGFLALSFLFEEKMNASIAV